MQKIFIACDHAGLELKEDIINYLNYEKINYSDLGCHTQDSVDYPDYANKLANEIKNNEQGILICGSGIGISIAANRHKHIRAALCTTPEMAKLAKLHNNANVLVLGSRIISKNTALECIKEFLHTDFSKDLRHQNRVKKLNLGE